MRRAALVIGASGGIGRQMLANLTDSGDFELVLGTARSPGAPKTGMGDSTLLPLDLMDEASIESFINLLTVHLDESDCALSTVLICSGILHSPDIRPERRAEDLQQHAFETVMRVNALGPLRVLAELKSLIPRSASGHIAAISARVGSISDNRLGGWYSYRCSKAALNMGFKNFAIELARSHPQLVPTLFHPGTVDTHLSEPFQSGVKPERLFSTQRAAQQFFDVLQNRASTDEPLFVDWAGKPIEF